MTLRDLQIGERFIAASARDKQKAERFTVLSKPEYNRLAGTATTKCKSDRGGIVDKQSRLAVILLGVKGKHI